MGLREPEVLARLRQATELEELSVMRSAPEQCQFMAMLIRITQAKRVIEVGTYTGYATLWMAGHEYGPTNGVIHAINRVLIPYSFYGQMDSLPAEAPADHPERQMEVAGE